MRNNDFSQNALISYETLYHMTETLCDIMLITNIILHQEQVIHVLI